MIIDGKTISDDEWNEVRHRLMEKVGADAEAETVAIYLFLRIEDLERRLTNMPEVVEH